MKTIDTVATFRVCFFVKLLIDSSSYNIKFQSQTGMAIFRNFFCGVCVGKYICIQFNKISVKYSTRAGIICEESPSVQTYGCGYIPTFVSPNLKWWERPTTYIFRPVKIQGIRKR